MSAVSLTELPDTRVGGRGKWSGGRADAGLLWVSLSVWAVLPACSHIEHRIRGREKDAHAPDSG